MLPCLPVTRQVMLKRRTTLFQKIIYLCGDQADRQSVLSERSASWCFVRAVVVFGDRGGTSVSSVLNSGGGEGGGVQSNDSMMSLGFFEVHLHSRDAKPATGNFRR